MDLQMVRRRFAELETELLWSMWSKDERLPEAEQALRLELIERGAQEAELDDIASRRDEIARLAPPSESQTIVDFGLAGRFITLFLALSVSTLVGNLFGKAPALLAVTAIGATYVVIMGRRTFVQFKHGTSRLVGIALAFLCLEPLLISLLCLVGLYIVLAGRI